MAVHVKSACGGGVSSAAVVGSFGLEHHHVPLHGVVDAGRDLDLNLLHLPLWTQLLASKYVIIYIHTGAYSGFYSGGPVKIC